MMAAPNGMPRNTATLVATVEYETFTVVEEAPIIRMNRMASGAYRIICRMELTATSIAQYSVSPPARPVQIRTLGQCQHSNVVPQNGSSFTIAMQRARPTKISPSRSSGSSGRKAQERPSCEDEISNPRLLTSCAAEITIRNGATSQFMTMLKPIWIHRVRWPNARWSVSNFTLQRIGYIITSKPMAVTRVSSGLEEGEMGTHL